MNSTQPTALTDLIYALAVSRDTRVQFAAHSGGLYVSNNHGNTWAYAYQSLLGDQVLPTLTVALSPAFDRDHTILAGTPGAILSSQDGGAHWQVVRLGPVDILVGGLVFSPAFDQDGTAFAVTSEDGVFCSYEFGRSWFSWNFGLLDANGLCLAVSPDYARDRTLYVGTGSGLFISKNAGKSWEGLRLPHGYDAVTALALSPNFARDNILWAGTRSAGLLQSFDAGQTWQQMNSGLDQGTILEILPCRDYASSQNVVVVLEQAIYIASDSGLLFKLVKDFDTEITAFCPVPGWQTGEKVFVGLADRLVEVQL
jgi:photosystem II stability/assembly factor-like uncharacterized protein